MLLGTRRHTPPHAAFIAAAIATAKVARVSSFEPTHLRTAQATVLDNREDMIIEVA